MGTLHSKTYLVRTDSWQLSLRIQLLSSSTFLQLITFYEGATFSSVPLFVQSGKTNKSDKRFNCSAGPYFVKN